MFKQEVSQTLELETSKLPPVASHLKPVTQSLSLLGGSLTLDP